MNIEKGSYLCLMRDGYVKMCFYTGSTWRDMWKQSLVGQIVGFKALPSKDEYMMTDKRFMGGMSPIDALKELYLNDVNKEEPDVEVAPKPEPMNQEEFVRLIRSLGAEVLERDGNLFVVARETY